MKKSAFYILILLVLFSCDYIPNFKKNEERPIAKVHEKYLFLSEIESQLPVNVSSEDSIQFVKNYINTWAKEQLLLQLAEINLKDEVSSFERLVQDYRSALYINSYKEALVLDKLNRSVSPSEIIEYYNLNRNNFRLNEELVQFKYIHTSNERSDKKQLVKLFKSTKYEDISELESMVLEFRSFNLNDSIWVKYDDMKSKIEALKKVDKKDVLKKSVFIQKEDSLGLYLISVKDVLFRNEIAPMNYVSPTIKQIILQKRKLELLRKLEVDLLNDAIKNEYFEKY